MDNITSPCFFCNLKFPTKSLKYCSACHVARYCSSECAKAGWKQGGHRQLCLDNKATNDSLEEVSLRAPWEQTFKTQFKKYFDSLIPALQVVGVQAYSIRLKGSPTPKRPSAGKPEEEVLAFCFSFDYKKYKQGASLQNQFSLTQASLQPIDAHRARPVTLAGFPTSQAEYAVQAKIYTRKWIDSMGMSHFPADLPRIPISLHAHHCPSCWDVTGGPGFSSNECGLVVQQDFFPAAGREFPIADEDRWAMNFKETLDVKRNPNWHDERARKISKVGARVETELVKTHPELSAEEREQWAWDSIHAMDFYGVNP